MRSITVHPILISSLKILILELSICLLVVAAACGSPKDGASDDAVPVPAPTFDDGIRAYIDFHGAATASLEDRIYFSDIVVRARFLSASEGLLRFRALEYLKGSGTSEFEVRASADGRDARWDDREAVLFLARSDGQGNAGQSDAANKAGLSFFDTTVRDYGRWGDSIPYAGKLPNGYDVSSKNPVWLPADSTPLASGNAGTSSSATFIVDPSSSDGAASSTISLADLRSKIEWLVGGQGVEGYYECIQSSLYSIRWFRDWKAYHGSPYSPDVIRHSLASGVPIVPLVWHDDGLRGSRYARVWLSGDSADLFSVQIVDNDKVSANGYGNGIKSVRPLVRGAYTIYDHIQSPEHIPCNYVADPYHRLRRIITVTAPTGTLHEMFFDPVAVGSAVAADATNGVLKPRAFPMANSATATISRIAYEPGSGSGQSGSVKVGVTPDNALTGHALDFIDMGGTTTLSLSAAAATSTSGTLTWAVPKQPWKAGDKLMLRIRSLSTTE